MTFQLPLIVDDPTKKQTLLQGISPDECVVSRFNTRKTRPQEDIEKLAERIKQNGFELTRAPWAYRNGNGILEIFAGGTRLEAAQLCQVSIPIILFEGYSDEEIARLTDQDNENDEYHAPVSPVDVWAEYARLLHDEEDWTQQRIANVKGVSQAMVSYRLTLHNLPSHIKDFISQDLLTEGHLTEIIKLSVDLYFSPWLTTEQAWEELAEWAKGHTVRQTKEKVGHWKSFIELADKIYLNFSEDITLYDFSGDKPQPYIYNEREAFIQGLIARKARSQNKINEAKREITLFVADNLKDYKEWVDAKEAEAARKAIYARHEKEVLNKFVLGDCLEKGGLLKLGSVKLLLVDPPYGKEFQSNRRVKSEKAPKLKGDKPELAIRLFAEMIETYREALQNDAHLLIFCDCESYSPFKQIIEDKGFKFKRCLIWVKENHSAGDLEGTAAPKHEHILHAVCGRPKFEPRIDDVLEFNRDLDAPHPTAKPVPLLEKLILSCTNEGDLVIDPMAGWASTLIAAWNLDREFWGCEIDKRWHEAGCERLLEKLKQKTNIIS